MDWTDKLKNILFVDNYGKRLLYFLNDKEYVSKNCDSEKWKRIFGKIDEWKKRYFVKSDKVTLNGVDGWYMESCIEKFKYPSDIDCDIKDYLAAVMLIDWTLNFDDSDYNFYINNFQIDKDLAEELGYEFDFPKERCAILSEKEFIDELKDRYNRSCKRFERYKRNNNNNPKVIEKLEPQYPIYLSYINFFENNLKDCNVVRMNDFGYDETVRYLIKNEKFVYLISIQDFV